MPVHNQPYSLLPNEWLDPSEVQKSGSHFVNYISFLMPVMWRERYFRVWINPLQLQVTLRLDLDRALQPLHWHKKNAYQHIGHHVVDIANSPLLTSFL